MSVIEEKKALRTYIRQTERTLDPSSPPCYFRRFLLP